MADFRLLSYPAPTTPSAPAPAAAPAPGASVMAPAASTVPSDSLQVSSAAAVPPATPVGAPPVGLTYEQALGQIQSLPGALPPAPAPLPAPAAPPVPVAPAASMSYDAAAEMLKRLMPEPEPKPAPKPEAPKPEPEPKPAAKPEPAKPAPSSPPPAGAPHDRRESWYISQYGSKYNTNEDVPGSDNGNCGPTSLTMVAKAFGKISPNAAQADAAIEETRRRMGDGNNERSGTSVAGIARGAQSYGLDTKVRWDAKLSTIQDELAKGRLVIVHGTVIKDDGRVYGGHYYVVTKIEGGKAYLNDPAYPSGPRVIPASTLQRSIDTRGTHAMISIGP